MRFGAAAAFFATAAVMPTTYRGEKAVTRAEMHNVKYRYDASLAVHIRYLDGRLERTTNGTPPTFDDKHSFVIVIDSAEIAIDANALTALLNNYVFRRADAPIKNLRVTLENGVMKQTGIIHKGIDLPFEMRADVSARWSRGRAGQTMAGDAGARAGYARGALISFIRLRRAVVLAWGCVARRLVSDLASSGRPITTRYRDYPSSVNGAFDIRNSRRMT